MHHENTDTRRDRGHDASGRFRVTQVAVRDERRRGIAGRHLGPTARPRPRGRS